MNHWLMMFRPDTYEVVKARGVVGVLHMHRRRFAEVAEGDAFVAYVSKRMVIDGVGRVTRDPFTDLDPVFPRRELYPLRAGVTFERVGADVPARELLWELDVWAARDEPLRTQPWNMLYCYGGFMKVPVSDFERMRGLIDAGLSGRQ